VYLLINLFVIYLEYCILDLLFRRDIQPDYCVSWDYDGKQKRILSCLFV